MGYDTDGLRARVSDFGLAKRVNPFTLLASARGTRCFKAPEAMLNPQSDSCAGDVWAVGCTLYLLLTDRLPLAEAGELDVFDPKCFERPIIPASRLNIRVDPLLDQILLRTLALKPEARYPTAAELLEDLSRWKPVPANSSAQPKAMATSDFSKSALGTHTPPNENKARKMAGRAVQQARQTGKLNDAADLMEEAFNLWPDMRLEYEYILQLWRRGLTM